jgi:peptidoglycan hydrolase-like protein with peptidoglycan-binding domain
MLDSEIMTPERERAEVPPPSPRRRRRRWVVLGGAVVLAAGAAGALYAVQDRQGSSAQQFSTLPTVAVTRTNMVNTADVDGTLGYEGSYTVLGPGGGRITWLPGTGQVIKRGERVYSVDGHGVPLFYGSTPFWRDLKSGVSEGRDVQEVERNLDALGYNDGMTVDRSFTAATTRAVKAWQKDLGVKQSGMVKPDDVVMQRGAIRVTKVEAILGAPGGGAVLTASGTERRISVDLPVSKQDIVRKGAKVRITLPGGKTTTGRISSVGTVATAGSTNSQSQTGEGTQNATIPVYVTLDKPSSAGNLDGAPATVGFTSVEHKKVLAVPINALLAAADGSYTVNVVDASGNVRPVPVKLGIFDGDNVEVSGNLTPGMKVQVPRS